MSTLRELKPINNLRAFSVARWQARCAVPAPAVLNQRMESDRHGNIVLRPRT